MAKVKTSIGTYVHESNPKKTSISGRMSMVKFASMKKDKKRSFKKYRGQGR